MLALSITITKNSVHPLAQLQRCVESMSKCIKAVLVAWDGPTPVFSFVSFLTHLHENTICLLTTVCIKFYNLYKPITSKLSVLSK